MTDIDKYKKKLVFSLKLNGIIIRSEFATLIIESLQAANLSISNNFDSYVRNICDSLSKYIDHERSIERHHIERAIEACIQSGTDDYETKLSVIDAFDYPKIQFNPHLKQYTIDTDYKPNLFADASVKAQLFADRYQNILDRVRRSLKTKNEYLDEENKVTLHTVDYLLSVSHKVLDQKLIFGSLFLGDGKYFIEDPTGMIELDLTNAKFHGGFFYENCFVLVNGVYTDKILEVYTLLLPPGEEFEESKSVFSDINYFGGKSITLLRDSEKLSQLMQENEHSLMVFISDLWLDKDTIFEKLEVLFGGFSEEPPIAFVFLGNFLSQRYFAESFKILKEAFKKLANTIKKFDYICAYSHFIFVPGLNDPCMTNILPRISFPPHVTEEFRKLIPKSTFTTNPCRIQYCTREIVVMRSDLMMKFNRVTVNKPNKDKIDDFITKTITSQGHLSPFSLNVQPVHWALDHTLTLYPLPNLVVIGDKSVPYSGKYKGCSVINPGCFYENAFSFKTYTPASDTIDDCSL